MSPTRTSRSGFERRAIAIIFGDRSSAKIVTPRCADIARHVPAHRRDRDETAAAGLLGKPVQEMSIRWLAVELRREMFSVRGGPES